MGLNFRSHGYRNVQTRSVNSSLIYDKRMQLKIYVYINVWKTSEWKTSKKIIIYCNSNNHLHIHTKCNKFPSTKTYNYVYKLKYQISKRVTCLLRKIINTDLSCNLNSKIWKNKMNILSYSLSDEGLVKLNALYRSMFQKH